MEFHVIEHPILTKVMSRHAKILREDVFKYCIMYGTAGQSPVQVREFCNAIVTAYNPIVWERAIFCAHPSEIMDALERSTSTTGNIKGGRKKEIDWLKIATEFDYKIWISKVKNKRETNRIEPSDFDKVIQQFTAIYRPICNWLLSDFGFGALFQIFDMSRRYSPLIVNECIEMVDNPQNRSIDYLLAVIDKELAIRYVQMMENKELLDRSKNLISAVVSIAAKCDSPIDWQLIDQIIDVDAANKSEFDKVKGS